MCLQVPNSTCVNAKQHHDVADSLKERTKKEQTLRFKLLKYTRCFSQQVLLQGQYMTMM